MKSVVLIFLFAICGDLAFGQQECRSVSYKEDLIRLRPELALKFTSVESFTQDYIQRKKTHVNDLQAPGKDLTVITIPVVVHVLYNVSNQNISDAQIQSQIDVLNRDYRRLNTDTGKTPAVFRDFAADCGIEFVLAKADPHGNPSTGIVRKHTGTVGFSIDDRIKSSADGGDDAWDADSYLNIWVGNLSAGILGYSSIPGTGKDKDGVVIQFSAFGTTGVLMSPFNKGRTATHEIGHWLNLIHTWGDENCGDDHVDDTPPQKGPNRGCPGAIKITCGTGPYGDMYMDYMDFTDDACMNMFTAGQRDRMRALFAPGGPRNAILQSTAATASVGTVVGEATPTMETADGSLHLFPNPAASTVSIQMRDSMTQAVQLGIYNSMGQKMMSFQMTQPLQQINVSALRAGVYYIKVENGGNRKVTRLLKM